MKRRDIIKSGLLTPLLTFNTNETNPPYQTSPLKGRVNHSACRWCYQSIPLGKLAEDAVELGLKSIELLSLDEIDEINKWNLTCAIANGSSLGITKGFNDVNNHEKLLNDFNYLLPRLHDKGINQIICFSGNKGNLSNNEGIENCAIGLEPILKIANRYKLNVVMELLNSKIDHIDYQCDHTEWGVNLAKKLSHENFGLLYDIYHMQIMEGDVINTIRKNHNYIFHYHTGGVPGRNEINETQELNYKAIISAIVNTGYNGYIAQEFIPTTNDMLSSLKEGINICDI